MRDIPIIRSFAEINVVKGGLYIFDIQGTTARSTDTEADRQKIAEKLVEIREKGGEFFFATSVSPSGLADIKKELEFLSATALSSDTFKESDIFKSNILLCGSTPKASALKELVTGENLDFSHTVFVDDNAINAMAVQNTNKSWEVFIMKKKQETQEAPNVTEGGGASAVSRL